MIDIHIGRCIVMIGSARYWMYLTDPDHTPEWSRHMAGIEFTSYCDFIQSIPSLPYPYTCPLFRYIPGNARAIGAEKT